MQPKTKLQHEIVGLYKKLPKITNQQKAWAYDHCLKHKGYKTKNGNIVCLDCGHSFQHDATDLYLSIEGYDCPKCGKHLEITVTRKLKDDQGAYFCIITAINGYQVVRYFDINVYYYKGKPASRSCFEIVQHWITPKGKHEVIARLCGGIHFRTANWSGAMELRNRNNDNYRLVPCKIYPRMKLIPEIKRNGFKDNYHGLTPQTFFRLILGHPKAETLLKAGQYELLKSYENYIDSIVEKWKSIKICIRNGYYIKDVSMWFDLLLLLSFFNKDIENTKYICPKNLKRDHDKLSDKRQRILEIEREKERKEKAAADEMAFRELKGKFFDIELIDDEIKVIVLKSPVDYIDEGKALHHCVGTASYWNRKDSLVLSARINDKPIETIEVNIHNFSIAQCRGVCNKNTEYHNRILELVNRNMKVIRKASKSNARVQPCHNH